MHQTNSEIGEIDREIRQLIFALGSESPAAAVHRDHLQSRLDMLKARRLECMQPKGYKRMLSALGE